MQVGRYYIKTSDICGLYKVFNGKFFLENIKNSLWNSVNIIDKAGREVSLLIHINKKHSAACFCQTSTQVIGYIGFSYATL